MFGVTVALTTIGVLAHFEGHTTGVLAGCEELKRWSHLSSLTELQPHLWSESWRASLFISRARTLSLLRKLKSVSVCLRSA